MSSAKRMIEEEIEEANQINKNGFSRIAAAITPCLVGSQDASGVHVESLTEAVMGMTKALMAISESLNSIAEAIDEKGE